MEPPGEHAKKLTGFRNILHKSSQPATKPTAAAEDEDYVCVPHTSSPPTVLRQQEYYQPLHGSTQSVSSSTSQQTQQRRRKSLHKKRSVLSQYQTTSITKHYEISSQILAAFDSHYTNHLWVTAYAVGLQYIETVLLEIPKHGYFYSDRHERERMESSLEAARVALLLQDLLQKQQLHEDPQPDGEPTAGLVPSGDLHHVEKLMTLALEQVQQASTDQDQSSAQKKAFQMARAEVEDDRRYDDDVSTTGDWIVCEPLLTCPWSIMSGGGLADDSVLVSRPGSPSNSLLSATYPMLSSNAKASYIMSPGAQSMTPLQTSAQHSIGSSPSPNLARTLALQDERLRSFSDKKGAIPYTAPDLEGQVPPLGWQRSDASNISAQRPSWLQYRSSASLSSIVFDEMHLEKALFLSGLEVSAATDVGLYHNEERASRFRDTSHVKAPSAAVLELSTLAQLYHEDFDSLQQTRRIRISFAETFQGRVPGSTNGCTVIAPLLCIHHLLDELDGYSYETGGDPGLPDASIEQSIDDETPAILTQLRQQLGLSEHAFLIPADVHDYLIDNGQLSQDQFQNVIGGNILHDDHLKAFVMELEKSTYRKIAATLFFNEHVVAILKLRRLDRTGNVSYWYDFIDSLPLKEMLRRSNESPQDLCRRLGLLTNLTDDEIDQENEVLTLKKTARIRCMNAEALTAVIRWYACSKFNDENIAYIDQYPWDDTTCDFDPRVFQAFVWGSESNSTATLAG